MAKIERKLKGMDLRELYRLREAVDRALAAKLAAQGADEGDATGRASGSGGERPSREGTLRREKVSCGKKACKRCADGPSHGPYWYLYYYRRGRLASRYLGKSLPDEFEHLLDAKAEGVASHRGEGGASERRDQEKPQSPLVDPASARLRQDEPTLF